MTILFCKNCKTIFTAFPVSVNDGTSSNLHRSLHENKSSGSYLDHTRGTIDSK